MHSCLKLQHFLSFIKDLIRHFTANENEEIIDKIFQSLINNGEISTTLITNTSFLCLLHNSNNFYKKRAKNTLFPLLSISLNFSLLIYSNFALINLTETAPKSIMIPASSSIAGIELPNNGYSPKLTIDATICGRQILVLNKPRYAPEFSPSIASVNNVNGCVFIVKLLIPINTKEKMSNH